MDCRIVLNSLSDYLDGSLLDTEIRLIEAHLGDCPPCHTVRLELVEIRSAARELPLHTPQRALWTRIRMSLETETAQWGREREVVRQPGWWSRFMSRRFTFTLPQLAGASALAVALIAFGLIGALRQTRLTPINGTAGSSFNQAATAVILPGEPQLKADIEHRVSTLNARKATWDPQMQEIFDSHLMRIDQSLNSCRHHLVIDPADQEHKRMLWDLYEEKIQLLKDFDQLK